MQSDQPSGEDGARGLGITDAEFDIVVGHLSEALDKYKVPATEHKELMAIIATLRKDIVER
jgi:truncated hemoglobin YjbI